MKVVLDLGRQEELEKRRGRAIGEGRAVEAVKQEKGGEGKKN